MPSSPLASLMRQIETDLSAPRAPVPSFNAEQYFSSGGRAVVGHTTVAGEPVSLEEHKGEIRHRQHSGASRMAADYGYIDNSKPDHDGLKTDAFVGPHRDSKKVFVVNQQHPHTGKFNEHKVLLGYNDRAHALRDYAHSFSDGLGHKRIQSVVEMGTHELKDWLKKDHTKPLRKAGGGPVHMADGGDPPPRTLTIRRGATPQGLAAEMVPPEEQSPIEGRQAASPSPEGVTSALQGVAEGINELYRTPRADETYTTVPGARRPITPQMIASSLNPEAQGAASPSLEGLGQGMVAMGEDPVGLIGGMLPGIGNVMAAADVSKLKDKIAELRASGDEEGATRLQKILPLAAMGAVMPMGAGAATKAAIKGAETGVARGVERELSNMGLYSHAAEVAEALPQAKGSPQQMKAMLKGVKQEELAGFDEAFAGQKSVTKDEIAQHFRDQMPVVEERVLGQKMTPEEIARLKELDKKFSQQGGFTPEEKIEYNALYQKKDALANSQTKFSQYTLPGGENYREVLLKSPAEMTAPADVKEKLYKYRDQAKAADKEYTDALLAELDGTSTLSSEQFAELEKRADLLNSAYEEMKRQASRHGFTGTHWEDRNVLAHLRMADRTGPNGEKILHVEEIQSDWGQKGKKEGFKVPLTPELESSANSIIENKLQPGVEFMNPSWKTKEGKVDPRAVTPSYVEFLEKNGTISPDEAKTLQSWNKARGFNASGVPTAPYVTNTQAWTDLALKRALKEAAEGGYDKLVWTPGAEQAKRYSLSTHVDRIAYDPELKELSYVQKGVNGWQTHPENLEPNGLAAVIGKEAADKLLAQKVAPLSGNHVLEAPDLVLGGEGMKGYYDKIVPNQLSKLVKKLDPEAKIGTHDLITKKGGKVADEAALNENSQLIEQGRFWDDETDEYTRGYRVSAPDGSEIGIFEDLSDAHAALENYLGNVMEPDIILKVPSLTITPKMRESILKGQTAYAEGGEVEAAPKKSEPAFRTIDEQVTAVAHDLASIAHRDHLDQRHLAYLLKVASGMYMPADRAMQYARQIMMGDVDGLMQRFQTYGSSMRTLARLNQMMGGKHDFMGKNHMGKRMQRGKGVDALQRTKEHVESAMESDIVQSRPVMHKALKRLSKRI